MPMPNARARQLISLPNVIARPSNHALAILGRMNDPQWLLWARRLQAISQTGLTTTFGSLHPADMERYAEIQHIAAEITALHTELTVERLIDLFDGDHGFATPKVAVRAVVIKD